MKFYEDKKVLVAGGTGLIGKTLVNKLIDHGAQVRIASIDDPSRAHEDAEFCRFDLTKYDNCMEACEDMDYVFNLLCIKGSPKVMKERSASIFTPMILFNTNLLEAARKSDIKRYLYTSTSGVYTPTDIAKEDDMWNGFPSKKDWYAGWAKRMGELQVEGYKKEYGWDHISIVRPANIYGPHDDFHSDGAMVVPSLIRKACASDGELEVWGDGSEIRDFVYVEDIARGMMMTLEQSPNVPINLGSGKRYSIKDLAETVASNFDPALKLKWKPTEFGGDKIRVLDASRAKDLIGWESKITLQEGIKKTMDWYKSTYGK
ncbi:NAD-dependent epimerase/dehydratase family protein [Candidatus Pacearchaeota archaeon]|nr:NAD-dependent epimerase/dehydratase family protein [Candidatus Pacearchaeota archaeon]